MATPFLRCQRYHDQASHFRKLAKAEANESARNALLELAEAYDQLADEIMTGAAAAVRKSARPQGSNTKAPR